MAFKLVGGFPENFTMSMPVTAGTAITVGSVLAISGNVVAKATGSSTIHTIVGVAAESIDTAASSILVIPVNDTQIWEADCTNNTAANQLFEGAILTDELTLANTSSEVAGPTAIFLPMALVGAPATKKVQGQFIRLKSTST